MSKTEKKQLYDSVGENFNRIYCRLINPGFAGEKLNSMPHEKFLDMAVIYYMRLNISRGEYFTMLINNKHLENWGMNMNELTGLAWENTIRDMKPLFTNLGELMSEMGLDTGTETDELYVLSNERREMGAICLMYPGLLGKIARKLDSDLFILPSSIHECLVLKCDEKIDSDFLRNTVRHVNETEVEERDILSYNIYRYNRSIGRMLIDMT